MSGSIRALAVDPRASTIIYAGSGIGGVNGLYKSVDGGENWTNLLAPASFVTDLVIDPQADDIVYAGTFASGVLKSTDAGATWTPMNDGLTNLRINTLAIDPQEPFHLYAGTDSGGSPRRASSESVILIVGAVTDFDVPKHSVYEVVAHIAHHQVCAGLRERDALNTVHCG